MKEKGINFVPRSQKLDTKKLEQSQVEKVLPLHISEHKDFHPMLLKFLPSHVTDRIMSADLKR